MTVPHDIVVNRKFVDACISPVKRHLNYDNAGRVIELTPSVEDTEDTNGLQTNFTPTRICSYCKAVVKEYDFICPHCGASRD